LYLHSPNLGDLIRLYSVPIEGPASASIPLTDTIAGSSITLHGFGSTPDGDRVIFAAYLHALAAYAMYSVPIDGPADAVERISEFFGQIYGFAISPDGVRVVYIAAQGPVNVKELFSAPTAGPPNGTVKLNTLLPSGGEIESFEITPDGARVVYLGSQSTSSVDELYSVPVAGPAATGIKLNRTLPTGGDVNSFVVSPGSDTIVYHADQETDGLYELYRVPIDGPASSGQKISDTLVAGGQTLLFDISADGSCLVYSADMETDDEIALYSVPLAGPPSARVKLSFPGRLGDSRDVTDFLVSPDGRQVLYRIEYTVTSPQADKIYHIHSVPVEGPRTASVRLHGPLVEGGDVSDLYGFALDSYHAVYIADQDIDGEDELYVSYDRPAAARKWVEYD
jgi:Tol biopolymer transport system component